MKWSLGRLERKDVQKEEGDTEMLRVAMGKISSSSFHTLPTFDVQRKINEIRAVIPLLGSLLLGLGFR